MKPDHQATIQNYAKCFEQLKPDNIDTLLDCFSDNARFIDPFNDVVGKQAIAAIFTDMFEKTDNPRFVVEHIAVDANVALLSWVFTMQFKGKPTVIRIEGTSQIRLDDNGNVTEHKDFWDPCQGLYEHLPFIGWLFRWFRRKVGNHCKYPVLKTANS